MPSKSMDTLNISQTLVSLLRQKQFVEAQETLFDAGIISLEPPSHPKPKTEGLALLLEKERQLVAGIDTWRELQVSNPIVIGNHFSISMKAHFLLQNGQEIKLEEIIVYQVKNGKIIKEQFFY